MLNGVGSVGVVDASGRLGVVVGARTVGVSGDGQRLMSYTVRTTEAAGGGRAGLPVDPSTGEVLPPQAPAVAGSVDPSIATVTRSNRGLPANEADMSERDQAALAQLRQRDAQVRQEENAHAGAAGSIAGPIVYSYQRGPDGRMYAVGGSVSINAQTFTGDPQEARALGARIAAAANAATNPSGADMRAASMGDGIRAYGSAQALSSAVSNGPPPGATPGAVSAEPPSLPTRDPIAVPDRNPIPVSERDPISVSQRDPISVPEREPITGPSEPRFGQPFGFSGNDDRPGPPPGGRPGDPVDDRPRFDTFA